MKRYDTKNLNSPLASSYKVGEREREREREATNSSSFTLGQVRHFIEEKCAIKVINEDNKNFLLKILNQCPDEALNIYTWATLSNSTGLMFKPSFTYVSGNKIHYLTKNNQLSFDQGGIKHKLIIGDNYFALLNLLITHRGQINVIYIDPPYGCDNMGECAGVSYKNSYSRDDLLSTLKPRLELARELLADDGVIFCSIDDRNQAYVKLLFDEVFGEANFISCFPRLTSVTGKNDEKLIGRSHDYVLMFSKNVLETLKKDLSYDKSHYHNEDNDPRGLHQEQVVLDCKSLPYRKNLDYEIKFNGKSYLPGGANSERGIFRWRWGKDKVAFGFKNNLIVEKSGRLYTKNYLEWEIKKINGEYTFIKKNKNNVGITIKSVGLIKSDSSDSLFGNTYGTMQIKELDLKFDNPKPTPLIKKLINIIPDNENATVLDFFAGSGTTGQAVLELNKEDGGNRQFILCVNNDGNSADICSERLHRVMTGTGYDGNKNFPWINKNDPFGDSLEIDEINSCPDNDPDVFKKINLECYFPNSLFERPEDEQAKRDWICQEFRVTRKEQQGTSGE